PSHDEAVEFLLRRTGEVDRAAAGSLARELGCLPLALEQAGAYIAETPGIGLAGYRFLLLARAAQLSPGRLTLPVADPVAVTSALALERVDQMAPSGATALRACAFLAPEAIPLSLLASGADELPETLSADPVALSEDLATLGRLALVSTWSPGTIAVNPSVQAAVRTRLAGGCRSWSAGVVRLVEQAFPLDSDDRATWDRCAALLPHALAVADHEGASESEPQATSRVLDRVAVYQQSRAQLDEARRLLERAVVIAEVSYGPDDPEAGSHLANLATLLWDAGDVGEARLCLERAVALAEDAFGADHPTVAGLLENLGRVLADLGQTEPARQCLERALAIDEQAHGRHHPTVAADLTHLALVLRDLGAVDEARQCFERALAIDESALGDDHPTVGADVANLALLLQDQGELAGARAGLERAVAIAEGAYGPDHPEVAAHLANLGTVWQDLGEPAEARVCLLRALTIARAAGGPDHPAVASVLNNLGGVLADLGQSAAAGECIEAALAIDEAALGPDHPTVVGIRANRARVMDGSEHPRAEPRG
ncbi:MAG: tetratricopeptide repeat protein, partial [Acidimicrobiia bacterium]|nr:tetratricopeptide repeat protein [Acidimicrobiia bacterium]